MTKKNNKKQENKETENIETQAETPETAVKAVEKPEPIVNRMKDIIQELRAAEKVASSNPDKGSDRMRAGRHIWVRKNSDKALDLRKELKDQLLKRMKTIVLVGPCTESFLEALPNNGYVVLNTKTMFDDTVNDVSRSIGKSKVFELTQFYRVMTTAKEWCTEYDLEISDFDYKGPVVVKDEKHLKEMVYNSMMKLLSSDVLARIFLDKAVEYVYEEEIVSNVIPVLLAGDTSDFLMEVAAKMSNNGHLLFTAEKEPSEETLNKIKELMK